MMLVIETAGENCSSSEDRRPDQREEEMNEEEKQRGKKRKERHFKERKLSRISVKHN